MEGARQIHELTMKLDTEEEWQKMASTAVGFIGGMLFCKWLAAPSWTVISGIAVLWIFGAWRSVHCKYRDQIARKPGADE